MKCFLKPNHGSLTRVANIGGIHDHSDGPGEVVTIEIERADIVGKNKLGYAATLLIGNSVIDVHREESMVSCECHISKRAVSVGIERGLLCAIERSKFRRAKSLPSRKSFAGAGCVPAILSKALCPPTVGAYELKIVAG